MGSTQSPQPPFAYHAPVPTGYHQPLDLHAQAAAASPLPSILQTHDGSMHSQTQQYPGGPMQQHPYGPSYAPPSMQNSYHNGAMSAPGLPGSVASHAQNGLRYPLPPQQPSLESRQMSSSRHKKDIKRRTKTGCLTCRKRRIKCDEGHPGCRNCEKSKRECLGYDPIFKQQPNPANIQPAPSAYASSAIEAASLSSLPSDPYHAPPPYSGTGTLFAASHTSEPHFEFNTSLDPALALDVQSRPMPRNHHDAPLQARRKVRAISIEELFSLSGVPPQFTLSTKASQGEIEQFYKYHFANGLDQFFETDWYSTQGFIHLQHDRPLLDFVAQVVEQFKNRADDTAGNPTKSLEAKLVWRLATMPRAAVHNADVPAPDVVFEELLPRIATIENLLTGQFLPVDQVPPSSSLPRPSPAESAADPRASQPIFWHHLARFVSLRDDSVDPSVQKSINDVLASMRGILGMLEHRDVLYSIAIVRHIGGRMPEFHPQRHLVVSNNDAANEVNKLKVAHVFVEGEEQRGMTQVIQRMCSMALRSWTLAKQVDVDHDAH